MCVCTFSHNLINFALGTLLRTKNALEQEKKYMMAKQTGLEEELRVMQENLGKNKVCVCVCACMYYIISVLSFDLYQLLHCKCTSVACTITK